MLLLSTLAAASPFDGSWTMVGGQVPGEEVVLLAEQFKQMMPHCALVELRMVFRGDDLTVEGTTLCETLKDEPSFEVPADHPLARWSQCDASLTVSGVVSGDRVVLPVDIKAEGHLHAVRRIASGSEVNTSTRASSCSVSLNAMDGTLSLDGDTLHLSSEAGVVFLSRSAPINARALIGAHQGG